MPETMDMRKNITWVTADYFVDCDFNPDVLRVILGEYDIHWIILMPAVNSRFREEEFRQLSKLPGLTIEIQRIGFRQRDPRRLMFYSQLVKKIRRLNADVTYLNIFADPYLSVASRLLDRSKTIFCAHDAEVTSLFPYPAITKMAFRGYYTSAKFAVLFSDPQANRFREIYQKTNVFVVPLALKNFGPKSIAIENSGMIRFLSFGVINSSKNLDLLIQAACKVYEKGYKNFRVSINGFCDNWAFYESFIKYPELFECNIRMIGNNEIADLFSTAHYFVQPYRQVSQSGAMKVAFFYNVPILASDYPGFSNEIKDGVNGYLFDPSSVENLVNLMIYRIESHTEQYDGLLERMAQHTDEKYSSAEIGKRYLSVFSNVIQA